MFEFLSVQVTIIIFLSVVGALLLYMVFLLLIDPLIRKKEPYTQRLHNEEDSEVNYELNLKSFFSSVCMYQCIHVKLLIFRKCVPKRTVAKLEETQSWSGLREHSSVGRSKSRNSARLFLIATRCLVKIQW